MSRPSSLSSPRFSRTTWLVCNPPPAQMCWTVAICAMSTFTLLSQTLFRPLPPPLTHTQKHTGHNHTVALTLHPRLPHTHTHRVHAVCLSDHVSAARDARPARAPSLPGALPTPARPAPLGEARCVMVHSNDYTYGAVNVLSFMSDFYVFDGPKFEAMEC